MKLHQWQHYAALFLFSCSSGQLHAADILLTNDDGYDRGNIVAVYDALTRAGHRVLIAAPATDQSGRGGALTLGTKSIQHIVSPNKDINGVEGARDDAGLQLETGSGTPYTAVIFGLDILALQRWKKVPDLVISGPNYGNNTGAVTQASGTFNAALATLNRGIPSIAVSTAQTAPKSAGGSFPEPTTTDREVAAWLTAFVARLETGKAASGSEALLPAGIGLNINFPSFSAGQAMQLPVRQSRLGLASVGVEITGNQSGAYRYQFTNAAKVALSAGRKILDTAPLSEQNLIDTGAIAISPIQGTPQAFVAAEDSVRQRLPAFFQ